MLVTLCSSAAFYKHVNELADQLETLRHVAVVPATAQKMRDSGDYEVMNYKTWYKNTQDFTKKRQLMDDHFRAIARGNAILVVNDKKHGIDGYIGPDVLMEIAVAYRLKKPVYLLNAISQEMSLYEEMEGIGAIVLDGNLSKIVD